MISIDLLIIFLFLTYLLSRLSYFYFYFFLYLPHDHHGQQEHHRPETLDISEEPRKE